MTHKRNTCNTDCSLLRNAAKSTCQYPRIRDLFHVYLNKFEFRFLRLHINKTNKFCFFMHNGHVFGIAV